MTTVSQPLTISIRDVNDAPSFTDAPYSVSVNENEAAGAVYTVSASDPDSGKFLENGLKKRTVTPVFLCYSNLFRPSQVFHKTSVIIKLSKNIYAFYVCFSDCFSLHLKLKYSNLFKHLFNFSEKHKTAELGRKENCDANAFWYLNLFLKNNLKKLSELNSARLKFARSIIFDPEHRYEKVSWKYA